MNINETLRYSDLGLPEDIARRKAYGDFEGAIALIDRALAQRQPALVAACLTAQRELIARLPDDYPYTFDAALARVRSSIPDFTADELRACIDDGRIDWIYVGGELRLVDSFYGTLRKTWPAFAARLSGEEACAARQSNDAHEALRERAMAHMRAHGSMAVRTRVRAFLSVRDEAFRPGETLRVHLPIPAECPQQSDITLHAFSHAPAHVAPPDAAARTVCFERTSEHNEPFWVEYSLVHRARYTDLSQARAEGTQPDFCLGEEHPHIVFTPYLRMLAAELTAGCDGPIEKARAIYDFVTQQVRYAFMREYFGLEHIAENTARNRRGDCGVQAVLFITLCRICGVPAQWQSGRTAEPEGVGRHDWAMFYVAPYGWLFADCSFGGAAHRAGNGRRHEFYFGNLDPYRIVTATAFQAAFDPPKTHWRIDPYDNQRGEAETPSRGLRLSELRCGAELIKQEELI